MPYFAVHARDGAGKSEVRAGNRPAHRVRLRQHDHPLSVVIGGALLDDDGEMCGTMLVIEADNKAAVETYLAGDPYALAGLYETVSIHPYQWGLGQPKDAHG